MRKNMKLINIYHHLKLSQRLIIIMLAIGIIPLAFVSYINVKAASTAIYDAEIDLLENLRASKKQQIESYFEQVKTQVSVLAGNATVIAAVSDFKVSLAKLPSYLAVKKLTGRDFMPSLRQYYTAEFEKKFQLMNPSLNIDSRTLIPKDASAQAAQYLYISNSPLPLGEKEQLMQTDEGSQYSVFHRKYHKEFKEYLEKLNFYDMFLIEPAKGQIVYSVFKELDFATSLSDGPYADSSLSEIYKKAMVLKPGEQAIFVDYKRYLPSYNDPAAFVGAPIYQFGKLRGVLVFQVPISVVGEMLSDTAGLGETGDIYLVGSDLLMRSQSRIANEDTVLNTAVNSVASRAIFAGEKGSAALVNYRGKNVLSSYEGLNITGLNWGIITEIEESEGLAAISESVIFVWLFACLAGVIVVAIAWFFARTLSRALNQAVQLAERVAAGQLDNSIVTHDLSEIGDLLRSLDKMQSHLKHRIRNDERAIAENTRIRQALDNISSCMLVIDNEGKLVYTNKAMNKFFVVQQKYFSAIDDAFDPRDVIGRELASTLMKGNENVLQKLVQTINYSSETFVLGELTLTLIACPVLNDHEQRLGTVIEWNNRTQEILIEREVQAVVDAALEGDLAARICEDGKSGFFIKLSQSVNQLLTVSEQVTQDTLQVMEAMAQGVLDQKIDAQYFGVFNELKKNINQSSHKLHEVVNQIQGSADSLKLGVSEISLVNADLNSRTEQQSINLRQTALNMQSINQKMKKSADFSQQVNQVVNTTRESAMNGGEVVECTLAAMIEIEKSSKKIAEVVSVIDSIAFQINLLALNASVEAARVGEVGRGFSVVASEVRSLATISAQSAKEVAAVIKRSNRQVADGIKLAYQSGEMLSEIVESADKAALFVEKMVAINGEQSKSVNEINQSINEIGSIAEESASLVENSANASEKLSLQAQQLENMVGFFSHKKVTKSQKEPSLATREQSAS